jgi:hypothetical protein
MTYSNYWSELSAQFAEQRNYLDELFRIYPTIPDGIREINPVKWREIEQSFLSRDNEMLIRNLLATNLFPIKDSYVAYLRRDPSAIARNPATVDRLAGRIYELGLDKLYENISQPKETNRQIGPLFKRWVMSGALGLTPIKSQDFFATTDNAILDASDAEMERIAREKLDYRHAKGLDFLARFNGRYIIGEAKFLTDNGGHQNAQLNDAIATANSAANAETIAILDGVVWIRGGGKMQRQIEENSGRNIMSALVLREFLYQL